MAGLLVIGFFCNLAVRRVGDRFYMNAEDLVDQRGTATASTPPGTMTRPVA
jgi:hypothetical protein